MTTSPLTHAQMTRIASLGHVLGSRLAAGKASTLRPRPARSARPCAQASEEVAI